MPIGAVVFDIGGVLEVVAPPQAWLDPWRARLGLSSLREVERALTEADPDGLVETGGLSEDEYSAQFARALGLTPPQAAEFMADMWDWYCGRLDEALMEFACSLRPTYRLAILSNSADGARREEERRYGFSRLFDPIIYSHEVGLAKPDPAVFELTCAQLELPPGAIVFVDDVPENVAAADAAGLYGVLHMTADRTIDDVRRVFREAG